MAGIEIVMAGDITRQHARIGRVHIARNQGDARARQRLHGEHLDHRHMRVATAHEHEVLNDRDLIVHHRCFSAVQGLTESTG